MQTTPIFNEHAFSFWRANVSLFLQGLAILSKLMISELIKSTTGELQFYSVAIISISISVYSLLSLISRESYTLGRSV